MVRPVSIGHGHAARADRPCPAPIHVRPSGRTRITGMGPPPAAATPPTGTHPSAAT